MRKAILLNEKWEFLLDGKDPVTLDLPHSWNGIDGQDGGNDYKRCLSIYKKEFKKPDIKDDEELYVEFNGVNSIATVKLNGEVIVDHHENGYSKFIALIGDKLKDENILEVEVDNRAYDNVYPDAADFTFYGGIYRDVNLLVLPKTHFEFHENSSPALKVRATVKDGKGIANVDAKANVDGEIVITIIDKDDNEVVKGKINEDIVVENVHLWDGLKDPYLYTVKGELLVDGKVADEVTTRIGFRTFKVDPKKGFFLNGRSYPLRGIARHQDRPGVGNAITKEMQIEDIEMIKEVGATTVRLSHYQHDQFFYDLCDEYGFVVWAEIPYISKYWKNGDKNTFDQMADLIHQNYNHPSIVCWGVSNEITMFRKEFGEACRANHRELNKYCHDEDPDRLTTVACFSMMTIFNRVAHITDLCSYNLYWGWYVPFTPVTGWVLDMWHLFYPKAPIGLSEYGAEGMPNLHSIHPRRFDNTEEYQAIYHEKMIKSINNRPYIWATHIWNMFDFGSDGRNQGGEKGINHKGLVTFDRKIKKDAFYAYKAYWSDEPFVHICGKRFVNRTGTKAEVKVYSNQKEVSLYVNDKLIQTKKADKVFKFKIDLADVNVIKAVSGDLSDISKIVKVKEKDPSYILQKGGNNRSWQK